jgi:hypothetical protein
MILTEELAVAILEWDNALFEVWQVYRHASAATSVLAGINMSICARSAGRIVTDIRDQLVSGELVARMSRLHAEKHPCLTSPVEMEMFRQFTNIAVPYLFWTQDGTPEREQLWGQVRTWLDAAESAVAAAQEPEQGDNEEGASDGR